MIDLGDILTVVAIYHDAPNSGVPDKNVPGVVKDKDGKMYTLTLVEVSDETNR